MASILYPCFRPPQHQALSILDPSRQHAVCISSNFCYSKPLQNLVSKENHEMNKIHDRAYVDAITISDVQITTRIT